MSDKPDTKSSESEIDDDLAALSALVSPSVPPGAPDGGEVDDGKLDLRALAASVPPPPMDSPALDGTDSDGTASGASDPSPELAGGADAAPAEPAEAAAADEPRETKASGQTGTGGEGAAEGSTAKGSARSKRSAKGREKGKEPGTKAVRAADESSRGTGDSVAATHAEVAEPRKSGGSGLWVGVAIGAAAAAAAAFFVMKSGGEDQMGEAIASAPTSVRSDHALDPAVEPGDSTLQEPSVADSVPAVGTADGTDDAEGTGGRAQASEGQEGAGAGSTEGGPAESAGVTPNPDEVREQAPPNPSRARPARAESESGASSSEEAVPAQPSSSDAPAPSAQASATVAERASAPRAGSDRREAPAQGDGQLDDVLDQALGGRPNREGTAAAASSAPARAAEEPAAQANLPPTPSRGDIARVLGALMPRIRQCAGDQVGMALATILVRNDGSVATVAVGGNPFGGTPQGACMEGAIRTATFPRFQQSTFRVSYPFNIR